jgi:amino-acid N-acetyltransferase
VNDQPKKPPEKIRITKLQEAQLGTLARIDAEVVAMHLARGIDAGEPRSEPSIARLTRNHDILVAEADDEPAGFLIWADQAPGVAWVSDLEVDPMHQRLGIGTRLLRDLGERAARHGIELAVTACWDTAPWALSFLAVRGFQKMEGATGLPSKLASWLELRGEETPPGQSLWWCETDGLGTIPGLPRPDSVRVP